MPQGAHVASLRRKAELLVELAHGATNGLLARFDETCRKLPQEAVMRGVDRSKRTRGPYG